MKKILIIYHKEDNDGVFSAAIVSEYINKYYPDATIETIGADYVTTSKFTTKDFNNWFTKYDNVIMTDISISNDEMMKKCCNILRNKMIWLDHHAPAIKASTNYFDVPGTRDATRSAILLAWKYFFDPLDEAYSNGDVPFILRALSAWDSFTFEKEGIPKDVAYDINAGVTLSFKLSLEPAREFIRDIIYAVDNNTPDLDFHTVYQNTGHIVNEYKAQALSDMIDNYGDFEWTVDGRPAAAVFTQAPTSSIMFCKYKDRIKNGMVFKRNTNGSWTVSLYNSDNDDTFNCGSYVKKVYGGGGHIGAAGCVISEEVFTDLLKSKTF